MAGQPIRLPAVAGSWYPGEARALAAAVDRYLKAVEAGPQGEVVALVAPHAGLVYSGPVAAYAYQLVANHPFDVVVLVGPSHHVGFSGIAIDPRGSWETPLGPAAIDSEVAGQIMAQGAGVRENPAVHAHEHSLEMQLPFLRRVLPDTPIVPLVMGYQTRQTIESLARALATALSGRRALIVASSDLSHYHPADTAAELDSRVAALVGRFDADGLMALLERFPEHACGGGPVVAVMKAARELGAREGRVLRYADSGDVSGDKSAVVGYLAAAFGNFGPGPGSPAS
jgi:AmmeMemoRadiSam system protein B